MTKLTPALVRDVLPGVELAAVQRLDVSGRGITTAVGLDACTSLTRLDASGNELASVDGIAALPSLRWLSLANNKVTSIDALRSCEDLEVLNLAHNALAGKLAVNRLPRLKALVANNNAIALVGGLERCRELNTLILSHNAVSAAPGWLAGAVALQKLQLSHNKLADLGPALSHLKQLKELRLNHNRLTSLPGELASIKTLRTLEAGSNPIANLADVASLASLTSLRQLSLKGCPVASVEGYRAHIQALLPRLQVLDGQRLAAKSSSERKAVEAAEARAARDVGADTVDAGPGAAKRKLPSAGRAQGLGGATKAGSTGVARQRMGEPAGEPKKVNKRTKVEQPKKEKGKEATAASGLDAGETSDGDDATAFARPARGAGGDRKEERKELAARTGVVRVVDVARLELSKSGKKAPKKTAGKGVPAVLTGSAALQKLLSSAEPGVGVAWN